MRLLCDISALAVMALAAAFLILTLAGAAAMLRSRRRWSMICGAQGFGADLICEEGVSVLAAGFTDLGQVERRLSADYGRFEVIVLVDSSADEGVSELLSKYSMIEMNEAPLGELPCGRCQALYRSRQRRYRRLVVVDRRRTTLCDDFNCGVAVAAFERIVALDRECELHPRALQQMIVESSLSESGRPSAVCALRSRVQSGGLRRLGQAVSMVAFGSGARLLSPTFRCGDVVAIFDREEIIAAGGFRDESHPDAELLRRMASLPGAGRQQFLPRVVASGGMSEGCALSSRRTRLLANALRIALAAVVSMLAAAAVRYDLYILRVSAMALVAVYAATVSAATVALAVARAVDTDGTNRVPMHVVVSYPFWASWKLLSGKNFRRS